MGGLKQVKLLSAGALKQFGAYVETLEPVARSSHCHWHEAEDEILLDELERTGKGTALATLCVASGMGAATIIERV